MAAQSFTYCGNIYTGSAAGTVDFPLTSTVGNPINYLEAAHIHVSLSVDSGVTWTELTRPTQWDFVNGGTVARLATGISDGDWIKVQRITPLTSSYVTFQPSSLLTAEQLNDDTLFNTYLNQERFDQGEQSNLTADEAKATANAASAAAAAATATANQAATDAASAVSTADTALAAALDAVTDSSEALGKANQAITDSAAAVATANAAETKADSAVVTANDADTKAERALDAVATAGIYEPVANVAAIPSSPADGKAVEVVDSTGIESFSPLAGLPAGFVGSPGLSVRIIYSATGGTWDWTQYYANDPDGRYLKLAGGSLTGAVGVVGGTAASPGISFAGDPNTGVYSPGADQLALSTNGTGRLTIDSSGNVNIDSGTVYVDAANNRLGVGTASPNEALETVGTIRSTRTGSTGYYFRGYRSSTTSSFYIYDDGTNIQLTNEQAGALKFHTQNTERLRITSAGLVGIGTSAPSTSLALTTATTTALAGFESFAEFNKSGASTTDQGGGIVFSQGGNRRAAIGGFAQSGGTDGYLSLWTRPSSGNLVERLRIINNGNVGIGTTSPSSLLHSVVASAGVAFRGSNNNTGFDLYVNDATGEARLTASRLGGSGGKFLSFYTDTGSGEFERARIDSSGRLLLGTSSALSSTGYNSNLQIQASSAGSAAISVINTSNDAFSGGLINYKSRGSSAVQANDGLAQFRFTGYDGAAYIEAARISAEVDGTPGANDMPGRLVFSTTADGASSPTERLRITSAGNVGIGTTSPQSELVVRGSTPQITLEPTADTQSCRLQFALTDGTFQSGVYGGGVYGQNLVFVRATGETARIDSSGRLLVGTSSTSSSCNTVFQGSSGGTVFAVLKASATSTTPTSTQTLGRLDFTDSGHSAASTIAGLRDGGTWTSGTSQPSALTFSTTADGASSPTERVRIDKAGFVGIGAELLGGGNGSIKIGINVTGSTTSTCVLTTPQVNSDVTTLANVYASFPKTQAAAFTLGQLRHYWAGQSTIGAGSVITNQYGFYAENNLTGATNNFGFYSNIASGANRWSFFANGTAANRFNGNVLIGGTIQPASATLALCLSNGTAPTGSITDGVVLYAEDVSASSELKVRDEAGNVTTLSPHNFDLIPDGPSEDMAWSYYSERDGKRINVDMLKAIRLLEQISGEKLVYSS